MITILRGQLLRGMMEMGVLLQDLESMGRELHYELEGHGKWKVD
jgi:hypothetical protein